MILDLLVLPVGLDQEGGNFQPSAFFAYFVADYSTSGCATDSSQRAAKYGIASYAAQHRAGCGADLRVGWVGAATCQSNEGGSGDRHQDFRIHRGHLFFKSRLICQSIHIVMVLRSLYSEYKGGPSTRL